MNDAETVILVGRARGGDRDAFEVLVSRTNQKVRRVAWKRLRDHDAADDVVQEVYIQVMAKLGQLRDPERFEAWVCKIAARLAINKAVRSPRQSCGEPLALAATPCGRAGPWQQIMQKERAATVRVGLSQLTELDRQTLVAFYFEQHSLQEMSRRFDSPIGTIKRRLHTARNRLRNKLGDQCLVG
jgi:RNA polymerase sigma-70 factor (ECF subfamily)